MIIGTAVRMCVDNTDKEEKMHAANKATTVVELVISAAALVFGLLSMFVTPFPITLMPAIQLGVVVGGGVWFLSTALNSIAEAKERENPAFICEGSSS